MRKETGHDQWLAGCSKSNDGEEILARREVDQVKEARSDLRRLNKSQKLSRSILSGRRSKQTVVNVKKNAPTDHGGVFWDFGSHDWAICDLVVNARSFFTGAVPLGLKRRIQRAARLLARRRARRSSRRVGIDVGDERVDEL